MVLILVPAQFIVHIMRYLKFHVFRSHLELENGTRSSLFGFVAFDRCFSESFDVSFHAFLRLGGESSNHSSAAEIFLFDEAH